MELASIIISCIACVIILGLLIFLIVFMTKKNKAVTPTTNQITAENINDLKDSINNNLNTNIEMYKNSIVKLVNDLNSQNVESINRKNADIIEKINNNNSEFNDKIAKSNNEFKETFRQFQENLKENVKQKFDEGFKDTTNNLEKVNKALGEITTAQRNLDNLSTEVVKLNSVLTNSQTRGRFGEIALEAIVAATFGDTKDVYEFQKEMTIKKGDKKCVVKPDCVIYLPHEKNNILCIDSKFSFNSYSNLITDYIQDTSKELNKDELNTFKNELRNQVAKIAQDYIIKDVTPDYALMFIPNDSIYFFIVNEETLFKNVVEYARKNKVILASPSLLQPILANIQTLSINYNISKNVKVIVHKINTLSDDVRRFNERYEKLGTTISSLQKSYDELQTSSQKIANSTKAIINLGVKEGLFEVTNSSETNK